jgi:protein SCO1
MTASVLQRTRRGERALWTTARWLQRHGVGLLALWFLLLPVLPAQAHDLRADSRPAALRGVTFDQRVNEQVPLDLVFRDETGRPVPLRESFGAKPVILVLAYYHCQNLCPLVLDGLVRALRGVSFDVGNQFNVVTVSFDPRDTREVAAAAKTKYLDQYGRPGAAAGWHFLTGEDGAIQRLTQAVGFHFTYDAATDQFAHASGIVVLTPGGRILRYMYGIEFSPRDLRLSLVEASANKLGTIIDQALLFCYHYDPVTGRYSLLVLKVVRLAGLATAAALGGFMLVMFRRDRQRRTRAPGEV